VTPGGLALLPTVDPLAAALASPQPQAQPAPPAAPASMPEAAAPPMPSPEASTSEASLSDIGAVRPVEANAAEPPAPVSASPVVEAPPSFTLVTPLAPQPEPSPSPAEAPARSWWTRLSGGLARTSSQLTTGITDLFTKRKLDAATLDDLEDILIQADLGLEAAARIGKAVGSARYEKGISGEEVRAILAREVGAILAPVARPLVVDGTKKPFVILMTGVNGAGKTTTIGKLAAKFRREGLTVTLAAGDTFRAAAIEQLKVWGQRTGAAVIAREQGSDAASLAFDALTEAKASGADVLLVDTAGRLQNKAELMAELAKVTRVLKKVDPEAPHAALLVLDATVGQNAISQVEAFQGAAGLTGLVMTKLDGTARGGILVALASKFSLPVHFIGVGEGVEDLEPFDATDFARAVAGLEKAP
jgi:fused signal recognition particle receptor